MTEYQTGINPLCSSFTYYLTKRDKRRNTAILATTTSLLGGPGAPRAQRHCYDGKYSFFYRGNSTPMPTHRGPEQIVDRIRTQKMFDSPGWRCSIQHAGHKKITHRLRWVITKKIHIQCITRHTGSAMAWNHPENGKTLR
jgi:hypothetical protein